MSGDSPPDMSMLDIDVAGAGPSSPRAGSTSRRFPRVSPSSRLATTRSGSARLVQHRTTSSHAHNAAVWQNGLLVRVAKGVVLEQFLYVRIVNTEEAGALFFRLLVVAELRSPLHADRGVHVGGGADLSGYTNGRRRAVRRAGRARLEYVSLQNLSRETWHFATHHGARRARRQARLGRGRLRLEEGKVGSRTTSTAGERVAGHRRVLRRREQHSTTTPSRSTSRRPRRATSPSRARCATSRARSARDDPRREAAQKTNAYQENRNLLLSKHGARRLDPGARDHGQRRALHPRRDARPGRPRAALLPDGRGLSRAEAERLIVRGFFQDVLDRIELEPVREALGAALEARIPQA